jgi:hypothetical protein
MAHYMLSVHEVAGEAREPRTDDEMRRMGEQIGQLEEEMKSTGAWVLSGRLTGPEAASVVRMSNGRVLTTDGPFAEAREHIGGFYIIVVEDEDEARGWASKVTNAIGAPIEVRQFAGIAT